MTAWPACGAARCDHISHMDDRPAPRRPSNVFRFRRLKWGAPKKLRGLEAIGVEQPGPASDAAPGRRGNSGWLGLLLVATVAGFAIGMSVFGLF